MSACYMCQSNDAAFCSACVAKGARNLLGPQRDELGWVVERYINSVLHYWDGKGEGESNMNFTRRNEDAIRFAREVDAQVALGRMCGGNGRATQHAWIAAEGKPNVER